MAEGAGRSRSDLAATDGATSMVRGLAGGVWWIAGGAVALLVALSPRYGWHRDELYFLQSGRHLAWGYVDQPPFTPLVARIVDELAGPNLVALRLLPALATAATIVLAAMLVRELGGDRRVQVVGAAAAAGGGFVLAVGHLLSTATFDLTAWMALLVVTAHLLRTGDVRWWAAAGAVAGAALLNKHLIVLLGVSLLVGMVVERRWSLLWNPWLLAGGTIAVVIAAPNLAWQAANGWPQVEMAGALSDRLAAENRATLVPLQLLFVGPLLVPLLWQGGRWLHRDPGGAAFRPLLWAWPTGLVLTFASGGRPYYVFPLTLAVSMAGVVAWSRRDRGGRTLPWLIGVNAAVSFPLALPVLPLSVSGLSATVNETVAETVGWPDLVDQVAQVVGRLPADEQERVILLTATYGEAGALDLYGPDLGLPPAHSPHNSYADFRRPTDDEATTIGIRYGAGTLEEHFERCEQVTTVENRHGIDNEVRGTPIVACHGLRGSWADVWPQLRRLS